MKLFGYFDDWMTWAFNHFDPLPLWARILILFGLVVIGCWIILRYMPRVSTPL